MSKSILIAHVVHALKAGGLENGLVNLINNLPVDEFRHVIICMTDYDDFAERITRDDVEIFCLHKQPGKDPAWYGRIWRLFRQLRPDIVHTRNLATIEAQFIAWLARVPARVHGEHGWDMYDLGGSNSKYRRLRKLLKPFIHRFIALSGEIEDYLLNGVGASQQRVRRICNGVDTNRFHPKPDLQGGAEALVIGTIGRMQEVKDPGNLVAAFIRLPELTDYPARLHMVGDGPLLDQSRERLGQAGLAEQSWLPGHRDDVAELLRSFDIFVLPSKAEGISNTILEAMATGLPIVATDVGGNSQLLVDGETAFLAPANDSETLALAILKYVDSSDLRHKHGEASRLRCEELFSLDAMVDAYAEVYRGLMTH